MYLLKRFSYGEFVPSSSRIRVRVVSYKAVSISGDIESTICANREDLAKPGAEHFCDLRFSSSLAQITRSCVRIFTHLLSRATSPCFGDSGHVL